MVEPLTITASIVSIAAPALHGIRALLNDVQSIKDAPKTIQGLEDHLHRLSLALSSLQAIENGEWGSLGSNVMEEVKSTICLCTTTCDRPRTDLQRWRSHSNRGEFSFRDREKAASIKQGQIEAMKGRLQTCQIAITSVVNTATFYNSIRHAGITGDVKRMVSAQQDKIISAAQATDTKLAEVAEAIKALSINGIQDTEDERRQLHEEKRALRASRKLLDEVLLKLQEDSVLRASAEGQDHSINVIFGGESTGIQIGVNHGAISGITFGAR